MKRVVIAVSVVVLGIIFLFVGRSTAVGAKGGGQGGGSWAGLSLARKRLSQRTSLQRERSRQGGDVHV